MSLGRYGLGKNILSAGIVSALTACRPLATMILTRGHRSRTVAASSNPFIEPGKFTSVKRMSMSSWDSNITSAWSAVSTFRMVYPTSRRPSGRQTFPANPMFPDVTQPNAQQRDARKFTAREASQWLRRCCPVATGDSVPPGGT
jgi:hypothetical protein